MPPMVYFRLRGSLLMFVLFAALTGAQGQFCGPGPGFKALVVHDYFRARKIFQKRTKRHPAASWYGLSLIAGRSNNPFHDIDSAKAYVQRSSAAYTNASNRRRVKLLKYGVSGETIRAQQAFADSLAWERTRQQGTIEAYTHFIDRHPFSAQANEARNARSALAFDDARQQGTKEALEGFLKQYPDAAEVPEANHQLQQMIYEEMTAGGRIQDFVTFARRHANSPFAEQAERKIYELATTDGSIASIRRFIKEHPQNRSVEQAWRDLYAAYAKDLSDTAIQRFMQENPDYPFMKEVIADRRLAQMRLLPYKQGELWGFIDTSSTVRILARYEFVDEFVEGQAVVGRSGLVGTINKAGKEVIPIQYDEVLAMDNDMAVVKLNGKEGYVDRIGRVVVPVEYDEVGDFYEGLAAVANDDLHGYVGRQGKVRIPLQFKGAGSFAEGRAVVYNDSLAGVIDASGKLVIPFSYERIERFQHGLARVLLEGKYGLIDRDGNVVQPMDHDHVGSFNFRRALAIKGDKCGYLDTTGALVIPIKFKVSGTTRSLGNFQNGHAQIDGRRGKGLIDTTGRQVLTAIYTDVGRVSEGSVPVKKGDKWGFASLKDELFIPAKYKAAWAFEQGRARVSTDKGVGLIDATGAWVLEPRYEALGELEHGYRVSNMGYERGLITADGREVIPPGQHQVIVLDGSIALVRSKSGLMYVRLRDGSVIWKQE